MFMTKVNADMQNMKGKMAAGFDMVAIMSELLTVSACHQPPPAQRGF